MRDLLYKNLTFADRGRKIIASSEIMDKQGIHSVIRRHFTCIVKQIQDKNIEKPNPHVHILKEKSSKEKREHFFCKVKGSLIAENNDKLFLILFVHTLSISLSTSAKLNEQIG